MNKIKWVSKQKVIQLDERNILCDLNLQNELSFIVNFQLTKTSLPWIN